MRITYRPALDGLRAVAVVLVLLFHAGVPWLPGGWLGVDVFFVLSGYLITSLLLAEAAAGGRIRLGRFWARRVRRLLPALLLTITAVLACGRWLVAPEERSLLRGDALAALAYVANWRMIDRGTGYVALTAAPSPLQHTWSLAIEEQFYLVWPLLVVVVLAAARPRALGWLAVAGTAASAAAMALTAGGSEPGTAYYGSGTRCFGLLAGCALAVALRSPRTPSRLLGWALWPALAVLVLATALLRDDDPWLYRGGLLVVVLAVAVLLASVETRPAGALARTLSVAPLVVTGRVSYGLYLWHWPVFLLLGADRTHLGGGALLAVRLAATAALAAASYVLVERPIRTARIRAPLVPIGAVTAVAAVAAVAIVTTRPVREAPPAPVSVALPARPEATGRPGATTRPTLLTRPGRVPGPPRVTIFGDSVARSLGQALPPARGLTITTKALPGCGIARLSPVRDAWTEHAPYARCPTWDTYWAHDARVTHPDVAFVLLSRWELMDRKLGGRWRHIGQPDFDAYLRGELERAIAVLSPGGARIVFATAPYNRRYERPDGGLYAEDEPARVDAWNALLRDVAARHGLPVVDLASRVCPNGTFTWEAGGVRLRSDGLHFTERGVRDWIAPWLLPRLAEVLR